jgi:hypothetical protein
VSVVYRVRQFLRAVGAWIQPREAATTLAGCHLPATALDLFLAMPRYDQQHALCVLRTLQGMGFNDPDLLAAALLHDVGKTGDRARLRLWHRVAVVLMRAFAPDLLTRIAQNRPGHWRHPFFVQLHHAEIGAMLAQEAGCSPGTAELIRRHEDPLGRTHDPRLAALYTADSMN